MKKAMLVSAGQIQHDLNTIMYGQGREIQYPAMVRGAKYWVFSRDYIMGKFTDDWKKHKAELRKIAKEKGYEVGPGSYIPGSGMCDIFTYTMVAGLNRILLPVMGIGPVTHPTYREEFGLQHRLGDFVAGAFDARFQIPAGADANGVTDGYHSAMAIATTTNGATIEYEMFEGQNERSTGLTQLRNRGCALWHVGM